MCRFGIIVMVLLSCCCQTKSSETELSLKIVYELLTLRIDNVIRETNKLKSETDNLKNELAETKAIVEKIEQNVERIDANISLIASKAEANFEKENSNAVHAFIHENIKTEAEVLRKTLVREKSHMRRTELKLETKFKDFQSDVVKHLTLMNDSLENNVDNLEHSLAEHKLVVGNRLKLAENDILHNFNETDILIQEMSVDFENKLGGSQAKMKEIERELSEDISEVGQRLSTVDNSLASATSGLGGRLNSAESQLRIMSSKQDRQKEEFTTWKSSQERQKSTFSNQISSLSNRIAEEEARKVEKENSNAVHAFIHESIKMEAEVLRKTLIREKSHMRRTELKLETKFKDFQSDVVKHLTLMNDSLGNNVDNLKHSLAEHKLVVGSRLKLAENDILHNFNETDVLIQEMSVDFENKLGGSQAKMKEIERELSEDISDVGQRLSAVHSSLAIATSGLGGRLNSTESQLRIMSSKQDRQKEEFTTWKSSQGRHKSTFSNQISSLSDRIAEEEARKVAFSAILNTKKSYYGKDERIVFDKVIYSYGGGYDSSTGIFTAPKSGTYLFTFNIESTSVGKAHVVLMVDGWINTRALVAKGPDNNGGNVGIAYLWKGHRVWVETANLHPKYYIWPYRTTFNGILID